MVVIEKINSRHKPSVRRFIQIPINLYKDDPNWVPPFQNDVAMMLNKDKHPFYEHSDADFYIATKNGRDVGRIAVMENVSYNLYQGKKQGIFYLFECEDDTEAVDALFKAAADWARGRGLNQIIGPKGFSPLDGYGILVEGFEYLQNMNMTNYNPPYYKEHLERLGFRKAVDFVSHIASPETFDMPERILRITEKIMKRKNIRVVKFKNKAQLLKWVDRIGKVYNNSFVENWEYWPLTDREIKFVVDQVILVANPKLIKIITCNDEVIGFLFAFPDVSKAMQRSKGKLFPFGIFDLLKTLKTSNKVAVNGAGVLPEFQGRGGNAVMYSEMFHTVMDFGFETAEFTQVAESAVQMRRDLETLGGKRIKNHRVYIKEL